MEHRLGRTVRVFLVVLATAGLYRLAVVPWVEPRYRETVGIEELTPEQAAAIRARADRRLDAVRDLFPPDAWEHADPIVMESRGMRLLFKQYHSLPDGRVNPSALHSYRFTRRSTASKFREWTYYVAAGAAGCRSRIR